MGALPLRHQRPRQTPHLIKSPRTHRRYTGPGLRDAVSTSAPTLPARTRERPLLTPAPTSVAGDNPTHPDRPTSRRRHPEHARPPAAPTPPPEPHPPASHAHQRDPDQHKDRCFPELRGHPPTKRFRRVGLIPGRPTPPRFGATAANTAGATCSVSPRWARSWQRSSERQVRPRTRPKNSATLGRRGPRGCLCAGGLLSGSLPAAIGPSTVRGLGTVDGIGRGSLSVAHDGSKSGELG